MNILEAVKSGKRFQRPDWQKWYNASWDVNGSLSLINKDQSFDIRLGISEAYLYADNYILEPAPALARGYVYEVLRKTINELEHLPSDRISSHDFAETVCNKLFNGPEGGK